MQGRGARAAELGARLRRVRLIEWFWRGETLKELNRARPQQSEQGALLVARARQAQAVARLALAPPEGTPSAEAVACELYRQAAYWATCALAAGPPATPGAGELRAGWDSLSDASLDEAVQSPERVVALRSTLRDGSFVYFAELPLEEQVVQCAELRELSEHLLSDADEGTRTLRRVRIQRAWRIGLVLGAALCLALLPSWLRDRREQREDLAIGKPWHTSSSFEPSCHSPQQDCANNLGYFFQTAEQSEPWIEFDLRSATRFSRLAVVNRTDCCEERATPLVVEVSMDHRNFREIARRDEAFSSWRPRFTPVEARYVRLRLATTAYFHLARVRILP